jgi:two-component system heavy metal sensor histidine kinase CusS
MRARSITLRLTLLFSIASAAVLLLVGALIGRQVDDHFEELDLEILQAKLQLVQHSLAAAHAPAAQATLGERLSGLTTGDDSLAIVVSAPDGSILFASPGVVFPPALLGQQALGQASSRDRSTLWEHARRQYRGIAGAADAGAAGQGPLTAAVAIDIESHRAFQALFRKSLALAVFGGIGLTAMLGWVAARRGLTPVREIARMAQATSASRLGGRLALESVPHELTGLATAFNDMLARLEDSFGRLSAFSSDLAHELRTPIGNVMTQMQVAVSKARSAEEYREVLYSALEEHERLARMTSDMLYLAKADHGLVVPSREAVDLGAEVQALFAFYEAYAEEQGVDLTLGGSASVQGDRLMIRRAVGNLLSNAIRHTARGGLVKVAIGRMPTGAAELCVENPGPAIGPEHLPRLFDRFYQVDPSRRRGGDGAGLGLAITKSIVEAHRATIQVACAEGKVRFAIVFAQHDAHAGPAAAAPSAGDEQPGQARRAAGSAAAGAGAARTPR